MYKEIKFRGKTIPFKEEDYEYSGEWKYGYFHKTYNDESYIIQFSKTGIVLPGSKVDFRSVSQFVGASDINGKDIYEGDIVKSPKLTGVVTWNDKNFRYWVVGKHENGSDDWFFIKNSYEVIGNVYENPELLDEN